MLVRRLKMTAFGPYAGETDIDFSLLGDSGIYIITGETGAGKTTIFDGISFALFGEASGEMRQAKSLRSKYAESDIKTSVELTFSYKNKEYKIIRNPEYIRPSKRGGTEVKESADAEFYFPDGKVVCGVKETNRAVEELIGMKKEQFNRVAMIAQGDFLKLLLAGTDERIKIFRNIFGTEKFDLLQKRIAENYNACKAELDKNHNVFAAALKDAVTDGRDLSMLTDEEAEEYLNGLLTEDRKKYKELSEKEDNLNKKLNELSKEAGSLEKYREDHISLERERGALAAFSAAEKDAKEEEKPAEEKYKKAGDKKAAVYAEAEKGELYESREKYVEKETVLQKDILNCQKQKSTNSDKIKQISSETELLKKEISARASCAADAEKLKAKSDKLDLNISALNELLRGLNALTRLEYEEKSLKSLLKERVSEYEAKSNIYYRANVCFLKNIAGSLAATLQEGAPCPVCGSAYHPAPASIEGERVSEEELESLKAESENADSAAKTCANALSAKQAEVGAKREALTSSAEKLGCALNGDEIQSVLKSKTEEKKEVEKALFIAKKGEEERKTAEKEREKLEKELEFLRKESDETAGRLEALIAEKASLDGKKSAFSSLKYPSLKALEEAKRQAIAEEKLASAERTRARTKREEAAKKLNECEGKIKTLEKSAALFSKEKYEKIQAELKTAEDAIRQFKAGKEEIKERGTTNKNVLKRVTECIATRKKEEERARMIYPLYATAGGDVSGKDKVKLETFVQMQYFDRVLLRANMRLKKMTDGQYELIRRENAANRRSQAGLDLDVIDHMNGTRREASTLSGGESFLASLSLALGLSDEIQSGYGGIRIDSMFIDEGFGSLSSDALDSATETLTSLSDGNLSIGIISHVEKLKERIDRQIIVKKCRLGSTAEVKIP